MEKIRNLSLRKSIIVYMLTGIVIGFILGAVIALEAERAQEQIWWKYVDQDRFIEEMQNRNPDAFDVTIPRVSNEDMSRTDARLSELCDFLTTYGILVLCAAGDCCVHLFVLSGIRSKAPSGVESGCKEDCGQTWILRSDTE